MKQLLIIAHAPSANTQVLSNAILAGCQHKEISGINTRLLSPFATKAADIIAAQGVILLTTENFGYMSGALKDCFDRCYYPCLEQTQGLPYSLVIRAGMDGTGCENAVTRIVTGLRWRLVQPTLICRGGYQITTFSSQCHDIGMGMAAGLESGIF